MTVKEALDTVSALKPHPYDPKHLLRELSRLDGRILREVWQGREGAAEAVPTTPRRRRRPRPCWRRSPTT